MFFTETRQKDVILMRYYTQALPAVSEKANQAYRQKSTDGYTPAIQSPTDRTSADACASDDSTPTSMAR
ncbi:hypothetical protein KIN20_022463 [Parelaphostrongylus tenuis]|uniref:Uncharacterized protein n=1 Tax=Parelaphostrongylus tenuis TaxID=148309 RepID=A0AAD5QVD4_PARTN|nr:hypothetical protein KIN20_022463 [Parelaphostrongylus tenuis]